MRRSGVEWFMTPGFPEIVARATGMAQLDCRLTCESRAQPRRQRGSTFGCIPQSGTCATSATEVRNSSRLSAASLNPFENFLRDRFLAFVTIR